MVYDANDALEERGKMTLFLITVKAKTS